MFSILLNLPSVLLTITFGTCAANLTNRTHPCTIKESNTSVVFDCQARHLKTVPPPINYRTTTSAELLLSKNHIHKIQRTAFQKWHNLTKVDLSFNSYQRHADTVATVLIIDDEAFFEQTKLEQLLMDNNNLRTIPHGLPISLLTLSLQYNNILSVGIESFAKIKHLKELYLDYNCFYGNNCSKKVEIPERIFLQLEELTTLSLSGTNLNKVPPGLPPSLKALYLKNNNISTIGKEDFMNLTNLEILHLSGNCPRCFNTPFACKPCPGQSQLNIHPNAFQYLTNLLELNLGNTSLTSVPSVWFQNLRQLKVLNLEKNYLVKEMASGEFLLSLSSLQKLDLSFNYEIETYLQNLKLSENFSKLTSLRELHVQGYVFQKITNVTFAPLLKIKTLNVLNFGSNFIKHVNLTVFHNFQNVTMIYLSKNRITPFIVGTNQENYKKIPKYGLSIHDDVRYNTLGYSAMYPVENNRWSDQIIEPICISYGKTLDLSYNTMFFIDADYFNFLSDIMCLNLSHNSIDQDLTGIEFLHMPNLTYLDLSYNTLNFASLNAFKELLNLQVLDLSHNAKYFIVEGVSHNLNFIGNIPSLKVLNISWNKISSLTGYQIPENGIEELRFSGNYLNIIWGRWNQPHRNIFKNFSSLRILDISFNNLKELPDIFVTNLPRNITKLYLNNNKLKLWDWKKLKHFKSLKFLDLSHNKLEAIKSNLFKYTSSLQKLLLHKNRISQLSASFLYRTTSLTELDLSKNRIHTIKKSVFLLSNITFLKVLWLEKNPFDCTCDITDFVQWIIKNNVTIPRLATHVTCATPTSWKNRGIIYFDMHACNVDFIAMLLFLMSSLVIVSLTALPVMKHLFYWDVWYISHWFSAKMKHYKVCSSKSIYDAFIAYDETDPAVTDWVYNELCHQIEVQGNKSILLCLEERDWEPGKAVIDNITQSINQSKKTLFVLTKKYINREKFRTAFYLAMQKLMDDNMDVIVIVLLEPVLQSSQYLRLRKKICESSILEWPRNPKAEDLFWQKLKNVLLTENCSRYNTLYNDIVTTGQ